MMIIDQLLREKDAKAEHLQFKLQHAENEIKRLRAALVGHGHACFSEAREMTAEIERLQALVDKLSTLGVPGF